MNYYAILEQVKEYLLSFFNSHADQKLIYHNLSHTQRVVSSATQIANHYQLNDRDFFIVLAASWFHDTGYYEDAANHEDKGAEKAETFLKDTGVDKETINVIKSCILATKKPQRPVNLLEQIICDADLFHLGTDDFFERNRLMRKETEALLDKKISKEEWRKSTIRLFETHHYYTEYAKLLLNEKKQENLEKLKKKVGAEQENTGNTITDIIEEHIAEDLPGEDVLKEKKKKNITTERGIETVFKITSSNNQRLSSMADSKAHIMIQVNAIIISILLTVLLRNIDEYSNLKIPGVLLLAVNLFTIIFSILATRPNVPIGTFSKQDIEDKKVNLLFFGNFYKMSLEDYASGMLQMMYDRDFLYGSLIRDVYYQSVNLGRKYRLLNLSYTVFMFGLIVSVIAFIIATLIY
jgi:predicted metal-dependent HD superfamily phosphohydrolase